MLKQKNIKINQIFVAVKKNILCPLYMFVKDFVEIDRVVSSPYLRTDISCVKQLFLSSRDPETDVSKKSKSRSYCDYCTFSIIQQATCEKVTVRNFYVKRTTLFRIFIYYTKQQFGEFSDKLRLKKLSYFWYWGYCSDTQPRCPGFKPLVNAWNSYYSVRQLTCFGGEVNPLGSEYKLQREPIVNKTLPYFIFYPQV